jgi:Ca2+-binding EF-hand superfamily protein
MSRTAILATAVLGLVALAGGQALADGGQGGRHMGGSGPMGGGQMMQGFDRDGDGSFTQEDVDAVRGERFAEFDADGDGALSLAEYEALWLDAMRERMVRGFQHHDRDGDALVTVEEFTLTTGNLVERHDRNGDGVVTRDELQRRPHGEGRRGGQRPRQDPPAGDSPN